MLPSSFPPWSAGGGEPVPVRRRTTLRVRGPARLRGATVEAADIRAVTALLIAALAAQGTSTIRGMFHLRRGYARLLPNLATLGAEITTIPGGP
ncbi:hypothetical protein FEF34_38630 [Streptomyces marianii]|uniref:UDP-N-acetylglucosamine 1-carboxyvinyltransferase n=1 Tax=Streptomyces marianii TaxID=1817406 RepID=A0A5R9DS30_9ACTN|nr:hypothetical protein FEF34_38630 [Streptomyces marianii]